MPQLPELNSVFNDEHHVIAKCAYRLVIKAQSDAITKKDLVACRVVGYLFIFPVSEIARNTVINEVLSIHNAYGADQTSEKVFVLGRLYIEHLIRPFRKNKGRMPIPSGHVSRPSFDVQRQKIKEKLKEYPENHAKAKEKALLRDGYRCMLSGKFDDDSLSQVKGLQAAVRELWPQIKGQVGGTNCSHIFSESTNVAIAGSTPAELKKIEYAASFWTIIARFGYPGLVDELNGTNIHQLGNILTLEMFLHNRFDLLRLWLEPAPDGLPNHYVIKTNEADNAGWLQLSGLPSDVNFSHASTMRLHPKLALEPELCADSLPLPNPIYLHIHASVCKVAHMSGAADYIDWVFREMEDTKVLAEDGTSTDLLAGALSFLTNAPHSIT